jgi:hypothetical protein
MSTDFDSIFPAVENDHVGVSGYVSLHLDTEYEVVAVLLKDGARAYSPLEMTQC